MKALLLLLAFGSFISLSSQAQTRTISGQIVDSDGQVIPFAYIAYKGQPYIAISDIDGFYSLNEAPTKAFTLMYSVIGYKTQEAVIKPEMKEANIVLEEEVYTLDKIVVTGSSVASECFVLTCSWQAHTEKKRKAIKRPRQVPELNFKYYPNPTLGRVSIESQETLLQVVVLDVTGKVLQHHTPKNHTRYEVDLTGLPPGSYFISVELESKSNQWSTGKVLLHSID